MIAPNCVNCRKRNTHYCMYPENEVCNTINILTAALECIQRQYDDVCSIGSNKCITCDFNCKQGTLKQRINALQTAINILRKELDREET